MPDQLTRALAGQPLAPAAAQQPVTELGLTILRTLVSAGRRLEMPPADELPRYEAGPVAETGNLVRGWLGAVGTGASAAGLPRIAADIAPRCYPLGHNA
jgi:hypothetical protein